MRLLLGILLTGILALTTTSWSQGQSPNQDSGSDSSPNLLPLEKPDADAPVNAAFDSKVEGLLQEAKNLQAQQAAPQPGAAGDPVKKQLETLQKQIEVQQKMIQLLLQQVQKQPATGGPALEKLQTQMATLEARSNQAAQRDQEIAHAIDDISEHVDATERNGPRLPATLKELFFPSRTNETPFTIHGELVAGYQLFPHQTGEGQFFFDGFEPVFLLQLNDRFLFEAELEFHLDGVEVGYAQMDWIVNDWLTVVAGRYLAPIGWFNERAHPAWINKLPDFPLMNRQVSLTDFSLNGVQLRGAKYLFCSPVKMEYSLYVANGLRLPLELDPTSLANLGELVESTKDVNNAIAWGGRVGFWVPKWGFNVGFSAFFNRPYGPDEGPDINLWGIDAGYHKGNWDFRFEYAFMFERVPVVVPDTGGDMTDEATAEATPPVGPHIKRRGLYAQVAYRPYDASSKLIRNTEVVFRYSFANFKGIDADALDVTAFESPVDVPVNRNQYTFGINHYLYESLVVKLAYEINRERGINLKDDVLLAQLAWGF